MIVSSLALAYDFGEPTNHEQFLLEETNRARSNPIVEAFRFGIDDVSEGTNRSINSNATHPLSLQANLSDVARDHSLAMLTEDFFAHDSSDGTKFFNRIVSVYSASAVSENISFGTNTPHELFFIDRGIAGRGHRVNLLNPAFKDVGIGQAGTHFTVDFACCESAAPVLTGVVFDDKNSNGFYDPGEGIPEVEVSVPPHVPVMTTGSGGYGLQLASGSHEVTFFHADFGELKKSVDMPGENLKVDVIAPDEFTQSHPFPRQCAVYNAGNVFIPCVVVMKQVYQANIMMVENQPDMIFELNSHKKFHPYITPQCATYDLEQAMLHFPCVVARDKAYTADLNVTQSSPLQFTVDVISAY